MADNAEQHASNDLGAAVQGQQPVHDSSEHQRHQQQLDQKPAPDPVPTPAPSPGAQSCTSAELGKRPEALCKLFRSLLAPDAAESFDCANAASSFGNLYTLEKSKNGRCSLDTTLVQAYVQKVLQDNAVLLAADAQAALQTAKNSCDRTEDERVFAAAALAVMTGSPQQAAECKPWYELWWVWLIVALGILLIALAISLGVVESRRHRAHLEAVAAEAGQVAAEQTAARLVTGRA